MYKIYLKNIYYFKIIHNSNNFKAILNCKKERIYKIELSHICKPCSGSMHDFPSKAGTCVESHSHVGDKTVPLHRTTPFPQTLLESAQSTIIQKIN